MTMPVSQPQLDLLRAWQGFVAEHERAPSVRELCRELGRAPSTIHQMLRALERRGLMKSDGRAHGWRARLPPSSGATSAVRKTAETGHDDLRASQRKSGARIAAAVPPVHPVRVLGTIAAGAPIAAIEDPEDCVLYPADQVDENTFALRVRGDSMIGDHILDGDIVLVRRQARVDDGEIAVALLDDGTATLKRVFKDPARRSVRLQPANPALKPLHVSRVTIQGRVIGVVRSFRNN